MASSLPSVHALRAFEAVARHLSYTAAARELHVTPAAVKQLVAKLENVLGHTLIERQGHHLVLTAPGAASQPDLALAMRHIHDAVGKMRQQQAGNRLVVTVEASIATTWLVPRLERFRLAHPGVDVLIDSTQRVVDLRRENVDVAIRYGVPAESGLVAHRLFHDVVIPACSPRLLDGSLTLDAAHDLTRVPLIHWDLSHLPWAENTRRWFDWTHWFARQGMTDVGALAGPRFTDYGLAVQAGISGQGVLLGGWPALQDPIEAGLLVCPLPDCVESTSVGFDVVTTEIDARRHDVQAFVDWLIDTANESEHGMG